jgi:hypothetical protein
MPKYYKDCTLKEMFKYHDHTYMMSDDNKAYENGRHQRDMLEEKVKASGGWTKELCELYNKYAPNDSMFQKDFEWISKYSK